MTLTIRTRVEVPAVRSRNVKRYLAAALGARALEQALREQGEAMKVAYGALTGGQVAEARRILEGRE